MAGVPQVQLRILCKVNVGAIIYLAKWLKTSLLVRKVWGSISGLVKSDTVSPTARHRCDVFSGPCCSGAKPRSRVILRV